MYEPRPTPFASLHFPNSPYALASPSVADFGFLFAPGGGGAGSGLGSGSASCASDPASGLVISGRAPVQACHKPDPKSEAAIGVGVATTGIARQRYASQPVSVCSSASSPSSSTSSPSSSVAAAAAGTFTTYPRRPRTRIQFSSSHQSPFGVDMASQQQPQQHDVAAQQEAAKEYQPDLEGPLVGEKTPSHAITDEYAKADQVYVEKTIALPQTYSHYRPIQGDGNCGWRAIGFSYYEKLIEIGDQAQIEGEVARLRSLNQMLAQVGGYSYFEDWAEEAFDLLRELASSVGNPAVAHMVLHQRWNDADVASSIIYYLRLLAATYLKANADTYNPFVSDEHGGIQGYCGNSVEIPNREIEHLGIIALANILLKPVNLVLEIAYLDRSPGTEVTRYRFPEEANQDASTLGPVIYLLYRPDHYDILYPSESSANVPIQPVAMQVNRVSGFSHNIDIAGTQPSLGTYSSVDFGPLALIPGLIPAGADMTPPLASPTAPSPIGGEPFAAQQQGQWLMPFSDELSTSAAQQTPQQQQQQQQQPPPVLAAAPQPSTAPAAALPSAPPMGSGPSRVGNPGMGSQGGMMQGMQTQGQGNLISAPGYQIRFSPVQLEYEESKSSLPEQTFQVTTNTFKNSVWNRAHYGNPDFHPEEWIPDDDGIDGRISGRRRARKDS